jgi:DNA repair exonuclease SbcCD ATPase subunit
LTAPYPDARILLMPKPDIHQLEERVLTLMGEFRRLKEENQGLSTQVDQLTREKEALRNENNLNQGSQDRLSQLESLNQKNEKDRQVIRAKVLSLIKNLDKFDLA